MYWVKKIRSTVRAILTAQRSPLRLTVASSLAFLPLSFLTTQVSAKPSLSAWSEPTEVAGVSGGCPIESRNGNILYTASGSAGTLDIWTYRRYGRHGNFGERTRLEAPVSLDDANDFCPTPLTGNWLMFVSNRTDENACGSSDMYIAKYRPYPAKSFGDATRLACAPDGPNTAGTELSPAILTSSDGTYLYYSSDISGDQNIYKSEMAPDGSFGPGELIDELNTEHDDRQPNVSRDGLAIVFASDRDDGSTGGSFDVFISTRNDLDDPWGDPINLSLTEGFPTQSASETRPSLSWDMKRMYYGSNGTIYVSVPES